MSLGEKKSITGIILAGGRSTRIGENKAFLRLNSKSIIEQTLSKLQLLTNEVILATNTPEEYRRLGLKIVQDSVPHQGPLGGILAGLEASSNFLNVAVACDMPFLNPELLEFMIDFADNCDVVIARSKRGLEPLHAVYSKRCIQPIRESLQGGAFQIIGLFDKVKVKYIEGEILARYDPQGLFSFNINTLEDLEEAKRLLKERSVQR